MNPDMKRLCAAASNVDVGRHLEGYISERDGRSVILSDAGAEAIVRAVLMALREVSDETADVGGAIDTLTVGAYAQYKEEGIGHLAAEAAFTAMINHILAESAKA